MFIRSSWFVRIELAAMLLFAGPALGASLPGVAGRDYPAFVLRGQAELTWWGFDVYSARLWASPNGGAYAVEIHYRRDFSADQILDSTRGELDRLGYDAQRVNAWVEQLRSVIPAVRSGDYLIGVNVPGVGARFYSHRQMLGVVDDPAFARAFFSIWLGAGTRLPALREAWLDR